MPERTISRRQLMRAGVVVSAASAASAAASPILTPRVTEGPFYPNTPQADKDLDLTRIEGRDGRAEGDIAWVEGQVFGSDGAPLEGAVVDVWQANAAGRYAHERDPNPAPLDPNFQGWAIVTTDADGKYRFKTIIPGAYPATKTWTRPPHIHFKVSRRGYHEIITQMFFPGHPLNAPDRLLRAIPENVRSSVIAKLETVTDDADTSVLYRFDVALKEVAG